MTEGKIKISVYLITYNEEINIRQALDSVKWADEIVILDSFSTDQTVKICSEYTDKIFQYPFSGFGRLRNQAIARATHDWILSVDADERATPELRKEIEAILKQGPRANAYFVPRKSHFLGRWIRYCGWYPDYRQPQFFNKKYMQYNDEVVHESFTLGEGKPGYLKEHILQYPFRDIHQYLSKMDRYSTLMAQRLVEENRQFYFPQLLFHPLSTFIKMYFFKQGYREGAIGFILSGLYAYYTFLKYVKLWEITKNAKN